MIHNELFEQYSQLGWAIEGYKVPVYDPSIDIFTNCPYGRLLEAGTVVYFKGRKHFYYVKFTASTLEGSWVDEEGSCRSTAEFLFYVLSEDETITLVN